MVELAASGLQPDLDPRQAGTPRAFHRPLRVVHRLARSTAPPPGQTLGVRVDVTEVRRNPDGYIAQRFAEDFNGHGHWLLTYRDENGNLAVQAFDDAAVAEWPVLVCCDLHGRNCEPPSELCCHWCTETAHPGHADGSTCSAPDLSAVRRG